MGSKSKIVKYISPIIQQKINENDIKVYIEPFVGGCNVIDHICAEHKIGCDINYYLIQLMRNIDRIGELPEDCTKEHYDDVLSSYKNKDGRYEDWYIGAIGFLGSFRGKFFAGSSYNPASKRNYYKEMRRNLERQSPNLADVEFYCLDFMLIPEFNGALIYCDPPYQKTTGYKVEEDFPHDKFWQWAREKSKDNIVIISEENGPEDFRTIWEMEVKRSLSLSDRPYKTERLFMYNG